MEDGRSVKEILVIRLSALGDVVRTVPAVVSLANAYPGARITWLTERLGASFLEGHPALERVLVFPTRLWRKLFLSPAGFVRTTKQFRAFVRELRSVQYDMVVDFHGLLKSAVVCRMARANRRIGYERAGTKEYSQFAYGEQVSVPEGKLSRYTRNMLMAKHLGGTEPDAGMLLRVPENIAHELEPFFDALPAGKPVVAIHQGTKARAQYKKWSEDRYAALADAIVRRLDAVVVLTWAPDEYDSVLAIAEGAGEEVHIAPRTATPLHLAYILSRSDLYVGSDTGAMHIATLAGTPVAAIFGPTDPVENEPGPYSPHEMVRHDVACSPCRDMGCRLKTCMRAVEVKDVMAAIERLWEHVRR